MIGFAVWVPDTGAFEQYKEGFKNCHGSFNDFFSEKPGNDWFPSNKHFGHDQMLNQNTMGCDLCHPQGNFNRTMTFDCLGCHGTTTTDIT